MEIETTNITIENVEHLFYQQMIEGNASAIWKTPETDEIHFIFSEQLPRLTDDNINDIPSSFVVAPFSSHTHKSYYAIRTDNHIKVETKNGTTTIKTLNTDTDKMSKEIDKNQIIKYLSKNESTNSLTERFTKTVGDSIEKIKGGSLRKVVISRKKNVQKSVVKDIFQKFLQLVANYPTSFVSLTFIPEVGLWIGASPEILINKDQKTFSTMALAGTQTSASASTKDAVWKQKEIEEQAYVSRYIINRFKEIRLREFEDIGPRTIKAGNLLHLQTDFIVNMDEVDIPDLAEIMRRALHPTSAVCGMPREAALDWLEKHEGYDRKLYSGYLGPVNINNKTSLFVNLRCAEIHAESVTFYAGAGITADSDPESEMNETTLKMKTLENILL